MVASIKPRIRKGITYWPTYEEAEAQRIAAGATSVVRYALGYAVQWYPSGPYIGPEDTTHPHGRGIPRVTLASTHAPREGARMTTEQNSTTSQPERQGNTVADWQPIKTAPKDGTFVLLWVPYEDVPVVGRFHKGKWRFSTAHYTVECMAYCYGGSAVGNGDEPNSWAYLPPPPATEDR